MDIGSTIYVRKFKRIEVLRGQITGRHLPGAPAPDLHIVKLDNGDVIPALAVQVHNQDHLKRLYGKQNGGN